MTAETSPLLPRRAFDLAQRRINAGRVIVVNGPRQSGKTELLKMLVDVRGGTYVGLNRAADLRAARTDPSGFVTAYSRPLFVDEVQRGGHPLILAIQYEADLSRARGQFVVAGSTRFLTQPRLSESLAGRAQFLDLWPRSQGEIDGTPDGFVDAIFDDPTQANIGPLPAERRRATFERVCRGGFPEAVLNGDHRDRADFFSDYARTVATKDVHNVRDVSAAADLRSMLDLLAAHTAGEVNITELARQLGVPPTSMRRYLLLFETIFVHHLVTAWSRNPTTKVVHRPKLHMVDTGFASHLLGTNAAALSLPNDAPSGALLESFVAGEIARQLTWAPTDAALHHWRDRDGHEVDLVVAARDGRMVGLEVKAAVDVRTQDFAGLKHLQRHVGAPFVAGIVLHCGDRIRPMGPGLWSMPIQALWETSAPTAA